MGIFMGLYLQLSRADIVPVGGACLGSASFWNDVKSLLHFWFLMAINWVQVLVWHQMCLHVGFVVVHQICLKTAVSYNQSEFFYLAY